MAWKIEVNGLSCTPGETTPEAWPGAEPLVGREAQLVRTLHRTCSESLLRDVILPIAEKRSAISLRLLDWTVVNWVKQYTTFVVDVHGDRIGLEESYQKALAYWKRRHFDPFRRRRRCHVVLDEGGRHETTLGQLNFLAWTYRTGCLTFVLQNLDAIEDNMNRVTRSHKLSLKSLGEGKGKGDVCDATGRRQRRKPINAERPKACIVTCMQGGQQ